MYLWAEEALAAAGYQHYEISNWALPGRRCRHNLVYWRNEPYLGLGAGAHSCLGGFRFATVTRPAPVHPRWWKKRAGAGRPADGLAPFLAGLATSRPPTQMTPARAMAETAILGLRLVEGLQPGGVPPPLRRGAALASTALQVAELTALGLLERANGRLRLTSRGPPAGQRGLRALPAGRVAAHTRPISRSGRVPSNRWPAGLRISTESAQAVPALRPYRWTGGGYPGAQASNGRKAGVDRGYQA